MAQKDDRQYIKVTKPIDYVAHVEFNRPEKYNAFRDPMWEQLKTTFEKLSRASDVRAIVLSGAGDKAFTAGLDVEAADKEGPIAQAQNDPDNEPARAAFPIRRFILDVQAAVTAIEKCEKPVICVLHGICFGLAIDVSSACDIRIASECAKLSVREVDVGLAADVGTLSRLPKLGLPLTWVKDLCYSARIFPPSEALHYGFVSSVRPDKGAAVKEALAMAENLASKSPVALQGTKNIIDFSRNHSIEDGLYYTGIWNASMLQTKDVKTAMMAGLRKQKDPPKFAKL